MLKNVFVQKLIKTKTILEIRSNNRIILNERPSVSQTNNNSWRRIKSNKI